MRSRAILANDSKDDTYRGEESPRKPRMTPLGVGLISVASALAGGLTVAWWYRKTLSKLQNPITQSQIQKTELLENEED